MTGFTRSREAAEINRDLFARRRKGAKIKVGAAGIFSLHHLDIAVRFEFLERLRRKRNPSAPPRLRANQIFAPSRLRVNHRNA